MGSVDLIASCLDSIRQVGSLRDFAPILWFSLFLDYLFVFIFLSNTI
jgi:hypothetical protein